MDRIRCGVIGVGGMGRHHARFIDQNEKAMLAVLCDVNRERLNEVAELLNVDKTYTDYRNVISDPSLDMVSICLPHHLHAPVSIESLKAKKHVLTEKPIAVLLEDADRMIGTARNNNVQLGVAEEHRYGGQIQLAKRWITEGRLGKLYLCSCTERFGSWDPKPWGWRSEKVLIGGGSFIDQGHHAVDLARYLMGDPSECCAYMTRPTKTLEGEDIALVIYKHQENAISQIHAGWAPGPAQLEVSIYGLKGTVFVKGIRDHGVVSLHGPSQEGPNQPIEKVDKVWRWGKEIAIEKFIEAIAEDKPFEYPGEEGKRTLTALLAAYESVENGRSVKIRYE